MKLSRPALLVTLLLAVSGCAALAQMGGLEVCVSTPGHASSAPGEAELARAQPSASAPSVAVALPTVAPSSSAAPEGVLRHAQ